MLTLEQGDRFERSKAEWLRKRFPGNGKASYESVWAQFIGNDGNNRLIELHGLKTDEANHRERFAEAHYSMAIFAYLLDEVATELSALVEPIHGVDQYLCIMGQFFAMIAHLGQVCDMVGKIGDHLKAGDSIHTYVKSLQTLRSQSIHAVKIPMHQDYVALRIPIICEDSTMTDNTWGARSRWQDVNLLKESDYRYLADFAKGTQDRLFESINAAYPIIYSQAEKSFLKQQKIGKGRNIYAGEESSTPPISQSASGDSGVFGNLQ